MNDISEILDGIRQQELAAYCDGSMAFIDSSCHLGSLGKVNTDALILSLCLGGTTTVVDFADAGRGNPLTEGLAEWMPNLRAS